MNELRFYVGTLPNEKFCCSCDIADLMGEPAIGDFINLPLDADEIDQELYVVKQRVFNENFIEFFCKLYDWEE